MQVLVVGNGGREHALVWKLAQSSRVHRIYVAPGNGGTAEARKAVNVAIGADDIPALLAFANENAVELTVIGPEAPLVEGIVDAFEAEGLACFGPSRQAAQLEGSKSFSKEFMTRHDIPTAAYESFTELESAITYINQRGAPIVVKADGLAAGKGVVVAQTVGEAVDAATRMLSGSSFGDAGRHIVVEEFLRGEEVSFIAIVDGKDILPLASSQDHKARDDGDRGPNTGGMGAYSPAPILDNALHRKVMREVMEPTVKGLLEDGIRYRGFLYAGLMVMDDGSLRVLEFNCRCGDPETQPIMMRLRSDLLSIVEAAMAGRLADAEADWDPRAALGVVLAADGYPGVYEKGYAIEGLELTQTNVEVFHAGTANSPTGPATNGGRVLCVCALGDDIAAARANAYARVDSLSWPGMFCRQDIGYRALRRHTT
jgi:phosphoribosylamine---glycine ligase